MSLADSIHIFTVLGSRAGLSAEKAHVTTTGQFKLASHILGTF